MLGLMLDLMLDVMLDVMLSHLQGAIAPPSHDGGEVRTAASRTYWWLFGARAGEWAGRVKP